MVITFFFLLSHIQVYCKIDNTKIKKKPLREKKRAIQEEILCSRLHMVKYFGILPLMKECTKFVGLQCPFHALTFHINQTTTTMWRLHEQWSPPPSTLAYTWSQKKVQYFFFEVAYTQRPYSVHTFGFFCLFVRLSLYVQSKINSVK